jgi:hypothetical protein
MDTTPLLLSLLFGSIGFGYFIYGRRQSNGVVRYTGLALMVYPYFFPNVTMLILVGIALMLVPRFLKL